MSKHSRAKSLRPTAEQLTFFAAGFPASPPASPESEKGPPIIAGSGLTFCAWCLKSNPCSCWRKILAESLHFALAECNSANGLRVSLRLEVTSSCPSSWLLKTLAHRNEESESSSWATPRSCSAMAAGITDDAIANAASRFPNLETQIARMWPTPTAEQAQHSGRVKIKDGQQVHLAAMANWMTPNRIDAKGGSRNGKGQEQLCFQVKKINGQPDLDNPSTDGKSRALLNPRWVAQLQGFPSDWLDGIEWPL